VVLLGLILLVKSQSITCSCTLSAGQPATVYVRAENILDTKYWFGLYESYPLPTSGCTTSKLKTLYKSSVSAQEFDITSPLTSIPGTHVCALYHASSCEVVDSYSFTCDTWTGSSFPPSFTSGTSIPPVWIPPLPPTLPPTTRSSTSTSLWLIIPGIVLAAAGCIALTVICVVIIKKRQNNNNTTSYDASADLGSLEMMSPTGFPTAPMQTNIVRPGVVSPMPAMIPTTNVIYGNATGTNPYAVAPALMPVYMGTNTQ